MVHNSAAAASETSDCKDGRSRVGDLGIAGMSFKGSMGYNTETGEHKWHFQAEPKIRKVDPDGPAAGKLKSGDVLVAIDGVPITTHRGGQRFGEIVPGEPVEVSVRRNGRRVNVVITPRAVCPEDSPMHVESFGLSEPELELEKLSETLESLSRIAEIEVPYPAELPETPRTGRGVLRPEVPPRPEIQPRAWFGMGLTCDGCSITRAKKDETLKWSFDKPPKVRSVEPGSPAAEAGIEAGDVLTHVDGIKLDSDKGGERFSSLEPGDTVTWTIKRGGKKQTVRAVAKSHPVETVKIRIPEVVDRVVRFGKSPVRFTGIIAGADVMVRGDESVRVIEDEETGEILIVTCGAEIRVRDPAKAPAKKD
jgi:hypothetical protein